MVSKVENDTTYMVMNARTRTMMDLNHGSNDNGTVIHGYESLFWQGGHGYPKTQMWTVQHVEQASGKQWVKLQNPMSSSYVDLNGGNTTNGNKIHGWERNESGAQKWIIEPVKLPSGIPAFKIISQCGYGKGVNKVVDLSGGNSANGTQIHIWDETKDMNPNQVWIFLLSSYPK